MDFKTGGSFRIPTEHGEVQGEFLEVLPNQKIIFSWIAIQADGKSTRDTKVTLHFEEESDQESWLELIHEGLETEPRQKAYRGAWDRVLTRMMK